MTPYCYRHFVFHHPYECAGYELRQHIWVFTCGLALPVVAVFAMLWSLR